MTFFLILEKKNKKKNYKKKLEMDVNLYIIHKHEFLSDFKISKFFIYFCGLLFAENL